MQNKNFVLFMVTCIVIIMGWLWVQHQLWPPRLPDRKQADKKAAELTKTGKSPHFVQPVKEIIEG